VATVMVVMCGEVEKGRCDARCHNARTKGCDCCCLGSFHGVGLAKAIAGASERGAQLCEEYIASNQLEGATATVLHDADGRCIDCRRPVRDWTPRVGVKYAFEEAWLRTKKIDPASGHKLKCKLLPPAPAAQGEVATAA
jgi:hypothetical protein